MCDCYYQQCEECEVMIPVHIGDFNYPRKDVKVFCKNHLPDEKVTIYENVEDVDGPDEEVEKKGWKCGIRLKDGQIEPSAEDVCSNTSGRQKITIIK